MWRGILTGLVLAGFAWAQPVISSGGAVNAASFALPDLPNGSIALGSMFVVFGRNLGPATLVQATSYPLPATLAGTSIRITTPGTPLAINAIMVYT
ncbi:MAG: hypothetical protein ACRD8O_06265, partial [Bryobacteraceae bacterium]